MGAPTTAALGRVAPDAETKASYADAVATGEGMKQAIADLEARYALIDAYPAASKTRRDEVHFG